MGREGTWGREGGGRSVNTICLYQSVIEISMQFYNFTILQF